MAYTPYDWNVSIQHRSEYIEERLRDGSPVVGLSIPDGMLLVSVHRARRKIYEVYDRLVFSGIGHQSDVEAMRNAAIDFAHREGFTRSPDDVTAFRLVGSVLSPALKKAFGDPFTAPFIFRGLFGELGDTPEQDEFYGLGYDGEYRAEHRFCAVAGSLDAEQRMLELLRQEAGRAHDRAAAVRLGLETWATGRLHARRGPGQLTAGEETDAADGGSMAELLRDEIAAGTVEVALLERKVSRESKFRLLPAAELEPILAEYR